MAKPRMPDEEEVRIIRENGLDPARYGVTWSTEDSIHLLCYKTRDEIHIHKGDRPW